MRYLAMVMALGGACQGQPTFQLLPNPSGFATVGGISGDGATAFGMAILASHQAVRWNLEQMSALGPPVMSNAFSASNAGDVIVGQTSAFPATGFVWRPATGMTAAPVSPYAISGNGLALGGDYSNTGAALWSQANGRVTLGFLPGHSSGGSATRVLGLSYDGTVAVGEADVSGSPTAFRWDPVNGMQDIGRTFGAYESRAYAVSADGGTVVGNHVNDQGGPRGSFRLTAAGLYYLYSGGIPKAVSSDGWVIVGRGSPTFGCYVWDPVNGFRDIKVMLLAAGVTAVDPYRLTEATGISADGSVIVGNGYGASGLPQPWVVHIPPLCYPNCDGSTATPALNVLDFNCFLNKFTAGMNGDAGALVYANCNNDAGLNVLDFNCFLNKFVQGCP